MSSSQLAKKFSYFIQGFSENYFAMIFIDLADKTVRLLKNTASFIPSLQYSISQNDSYSEFHKFYAENYVSASERENFMAELKIDTLLKKLNDYGTFIHSYHHIYQGRECPAEIVFADTSDEHDGSRCILGVRFVEDLVRQQTALKKQNEMVRTLIRDYNAIYHIDLEANTFIVMQAQNVVYEDVYTYAQKKLPYSETIRAFVEKMVQDEYKEDLFKLTDLDYIKKQLENEKAYSYRYKVIETRGMENFEVRIFRTETDDNSNSAIMTVRNIDEIIRAEIGHQKKLEDVNAELKALLEKEKIYQEELKRTMEAAEVANKAKTDFLSRMSHDIRTPMNAIIGVTAIAGASVNDPKKITECLGKISTSSKHLLGIINDILDMSRIESGKFIIHEEEFKISEMCEETIDLVKAQIRQHKHDLKVHIHKIKHENVVGDSVRIRQIFVNILSNAVKYTPNGGKITVTIEEKKSLSEKIGNYIFTFEDNGIGMSKEFLDKIFQPFEREEDLRTSKVKGSGLGMAIAQNIVQLMGGTIDVESEYGKGSKFTVTLPLKFGITENEDFSDLIQLPILVADDDPIVCESTCLMLSQIGMNAEWVLSGKDAIEKVVARHKNNDDYFAIILDWKMPEMDGLETLRKIREQIGNSVPIIIFSAYDWSDIETDARNAGANAFISKPIFKSSLVKVFHDIKNPDAAVMPMSDLSAIEKHDFSSRRLLLVEDNEINLEIMEEIVGMTKAKIETAEDGQIALEKFKSSPENYYDMILMDIQMPNMNGHEASRAIRALSRADARRIPIIALTANTFEEDIHEALKAGMNEHLPKPIEIGRLSEVMARWIR